MGWFRVLVAEVVEIGGIASARAIPFVVPSTSFLQTSRLQDGSHRSLRANLVALISHRQTSSKDFRCFVGEQSIS
jgi:hypothetical protein